MHVTLREVSFTSLSCCGTQYQKFTSDQGRNHIRHIVSPRVRRHSLLLTSWLVLIAVDVCIAPSLAVFSWLLNLSFCSFSASISAFVGIAFTTCQIFCAMHPRRHVLRMRHWSRLSPPTTASRWLGWVFITGFQFTACAFPKSLLAAGS